MDFIKLIQRQAEQTFANTEKADIWLNQPKTVLAGCSPLQAAKSEAGYELVKAELEKISHGYAC